MAGPKAVAEVVRVYEDPGRRLREHRVLVDRLWPRGLEKSAVDFDEWTKDVAPSTALRRWYGHDPDRFGEFARRYRTELGTQPGASALERLREAAAGHRLVLLTATRDVEHSGAVVLRDVLDHASSRTH
ncbi:MAG: DUF488 domain-containing protein [Acidimicrobiales bacterium]